MTQRVIESLSEPECFELIRSEEIGRFVFHDSEGLAALPVNFGVAGDRIIFRTDTGSHLREVLGGEVAFEIDHAEPETGEGWSVLIRGTGEELTLEQVHELLHRTHGTVPHPWAEGVHNIWVAITPAKVTGRRLAARYFSPIF
jgi:uncharacterized protein